MRFNPVSTYRIQFHKDFGFDKLNEIIPYLHKLGIKAIYASPIFEATPGSTHGYDVINPHKINPEVGTLDQLKELSIKLKEHQISWIQDIVPNHMAFHPNNLWLWDVLEKGRDSAYADFFDISREKGKENTRLMVPFLGASFEEVVEKREIKIIKEGDQFRFQYYDNFYPLNQISHQRLDGVNLDELNNSTQKLSEIHSQQFYRLCHWQETNRKINFRRFFTINGLISLNMQDQKVFDEYHKFIDQLIKEKIIQGLRVDHVDGMYDPASYLKRLRKLAGDDTYIVIEKILEVEEDLPKDWSIEGSTGYGFLALANNLFSNRDSKKKLTDFYHKLTGDSRSVEERTHEKKKNILYNRLSGDLDNLYQLLLESELIEDLNLHNENLKSVIAEFLIECPVYRYYGNKMPLGKEEIIFLQHIFININQKHPHLEEYSNALEQALLHDPLTKDEEYRKRAAHFYSRLMQYTGPVMAKGVEDTLMYTYSRFIGHNEVGDNPSFLGIPIGEFHQKMLERHKEWPLAMNATSTHDTKRGEDVRMRLNVLTDITDEWLDHVKSWKEMNEGLKSNDYPDANDEYFLYQTLIGAYPMPEQDEDNFPSRLKEYVTKALREAKRHSNWTEPDEEYEKSTIKFTEALLNKESDFWKSFKKFQKKVSDFGIVNSLSQVILKYTCPGVPDLYQGCELWDLSLVDPDNRRPIDYAKRSKFLDEIRSAEVNLSELWKERYNGKIKLWLSQLMINLRTEYKDVFLTGEYVPLQVEGSYRDYLISYCRMLDEKIIVVVIPKNLAFICQEQNNPIEKLQWLDTKLILPIDKPVSLLNCITGTGATYISNIPVNGLFKTLPISILYNE